MVTGDVLDAFLGSGDPAFNAAARRLLGVSEREAEWTFRHKTERTPTQEAAWARVCRAGGDPRTAMRDRIRRGDRA